MELGESPRWFRRDGRLHWVDIEHRTRFSWDTRSPEPTVVGYPQRVTAVAPAGGDGIVMVRGADVVLETPRGTRVLVSLDDVDPSSSRPNDARADHAGRLWVGSLEFAPSGTGAALYRVDRSGVTRCRDGLSLSNGIAFSPDGAWMYHADTLNRVVTRSALAPDGTLRDAESFAQWDDAYPDGLVADAAGGVWVALWGGGRLERLDCSGVLTDVVSTPGAHQVTAAALGGSDLRSLYITTALEGGGGGPRGGSLFRADVSVPGLPEPEASWWADEPEPLGASDGRGGADVRS
ncbi:SMP-30/Gluconolaconase/LRE domain protein [Beutenbergia cavernae DSM 12333]|uniref:SMP-30/Gluconolaconase/LRE domain protein n=1 Tax=Beutenbergia cavernae (strain ATCC BAA-8 / DSM 12333 / CCUG 43141 / JCM 11478 / NBRC 16432 / NCIMB 13614 / HKI 0122) TaxID=471853 RepID=C5C2M4_BEUC1|nr:SMP-30/gluconolactonase/LRE family protein [Beutenbergia cavernae]ACQ79710.1 SMP-30/Gluconolaconase/LRE domain protein [Beutenbergia cavernae DSM 12333]